MGSNGVILVIGGVCLLIFLAFVIPPDYEGSCAPYSYGESALQWGGIPCKRGIVNQCNDLQNQSPINLSTVDESREANHNDTIIIADEGSCGGELVVSHNKVEFPESCGPSMSLAYEDFRLVQLHFHAGRSEHMVDSVYFDGELHLVHKGNPGLVVIGVFLDASSDEANKDLQFILEFYEGKTHRRLDFDELNPYKLVPSLNNFFMYMGSLTTPPCSSGVKWIVARESLTISQDQLARLEELYPYVPNNRAIQGRGYRAVTQYWSNS